jgi:DNA-binding response OmpR family regulator
VGNPRTIDIHVTRVRTKIEKDPTGPRHLLTLRGVGFELQP